MLIPSRGLRESKLAIGKNSAQCMEMTTLLNAYLQLEDVISRNLISNHVLPVTNRPYLNHLHVFSYHYPHHPLAVHHLLVFYSQERNV